MDGDAGFDQKINVNGSGISIGHPIAAAGAMRLVTLLHEMKRRNARFGLETICGGGGLGICAVVGDLPTRDNRDFRGKSSWPEPMYFPIFFSGYNHNTIPPVGNNTRSDLYFKTKKA